MAAPAAVPLTLVRGDTETITVTITTDGTTPVNITGRTYRASFALTAGGTVVFYATGSVTGASGLVTLVLSAANTTLLTNGTYLWELVETSSGLESTLILGTVHMITAVTP